MLSLSVTIKRRPPASLIVLMFLTALAMAPALATAGQGGAGSIIGQVTDNSGGALPGVTVTATSPALQVRQMTTVTNGQGEYRLTPLPFGTYAVEYELPGFRTVRVQNVQLTVGFVARLDQVMEIGTLAETVTVSGASPLVDTTSGATRTTLVGEAIRILPSGQVGVHALLAQVPGARENLDVGGSSVTATARFDYNGQTGQVWQLLEGVLSGRQNNMGNGTKYDYTTVENARVQTSGNGAEMPKRGMLLDIVTKAGGNTFHGGGQWAQSHNRLQSNNVDDSLRALGIQKAPRLVKRFDRNAQVGGKIIEDKLWFFSSARLIRFDREVYNTFYPDGSPAVSREASWFFVNKLSAQITPQNKVIAFANLPSAPSELLDASEFVPPSAAYTSGEDHRVFKAEWQTVRGSWFVGSLQAGKYQVRLYSRNGGGFSPGVPSSIDIATLQQRGMNIQDTRLTLATLQHNRGAATMYKSDWFLGNHEFKVGFDNTFSRGLVTRDDRRLNGANGNGNYQLRLNNGVPSEIALFNFPVTGVTEGFYVGLYAQDAWTVGRRLTVNLGIRAAHDNASVPEQCQLPGQFELAYPPACFPKTQLNIWNSLAPRFHAVYDLVGDGRSTIKGGWGVFRKMREVQSYEVALLNLNTPRADIYRWRDLNGNRDYDPGEVNPDPNGPDFIQSVRTGTDISVTNLTSSFLNPDERQPYEYEYTLAFEQQLSNDFAFRISGVYAHNYNVPRLLNPLLPYEAYNIPITNSDPGPDGVLRTADDPGTTITYYDFPAAFRGAKFQSGQLVNDDPSNDTTYRTIELAATKRLARNWQFAASYSRSRRHVPFGDASDAPFLLNPNAEINTANHTADWISKIAGSYLFPKGIVASANYEIRSGAPQARQVLFRGGASIPTIVLNVEPIGSINLPSIRLLDLRAAKQFKIWRVTQLDAYLDLFNVLNTNVATARTVRSGPAYLRPTAITPPRILQVGARFSF